MNRSINFLWKLGEISLAVLLIVFLTYGSGTITSEVKAKSSEDTEFTDSSGFSFQSGPMNLNGMAKQFKFMISDVQAFDEYDVDNIIEESQQKHIQLASLYNYSNYHPYRSIRSVQNRYALVIGNGQYNQVPSLKNPVLDSEIIASTLKRLGFAVEQIQNATRLEMEEGVRRFVQSLPKDSVALFYYAGHGVQITGENLLIPVDARLTDFRNIDYDVVDLKTVVKELELSPSRLNLLIIDACRDNPWRDIIYQKQSQARWSTGRSLRHARYSTAQLTRSLDEARGTLIAYATAENQVASDGDGRHSPYTAALLKWIEKPNVEIGQLFREVRLLVQQSTDGQQIPWENGSITGKFYFKRDLSAKTPKVEQETKPQRPQNPDIVLQKPKTAQELAQEKEFAKRQNKRKEDQYWQAIQNLKDPDVFKQGLEQYLKDYPEGQYVDLARLQILDLEKKKQAPEVADNGDGAKPPEGIQPIGEEGEDEKVPDSKKQAPGEPADQKVLNESAKHYDTETKMKIQESLAALDFYQGKVDGKFGPITHGAIFAFQKSRKFEPTGYLTPKELVILFADASTKFSEDPKTKEKIKKENGPTWYIAATPEGELKYVFGMLGDPEKTPVEGTDGKGKIPSTTDEGGIALVVAAKQANGEKALVKAIMNRPDLETWAANPPPAPSPAGSVLYRVVLNNVVYARPAKYEKELGYLIPGSWVYVIGKVMNEDWFQVRSPNGEIGYVESFALAPQPHLVHPYTLDKKSPYTPGYDNRPRKRKYPGSR